MSDPAPPSVKGWCPHLFAPMETGDGLLLRVKPFRGRLSAAQARLLAALAPGAMELTNRGNLQLRGVAPTRADAMARAVVEAGLADPDAGREARRNLIGPPLIGDDPALSPGLAEWHAALSALLAEAGPLPGKFGAALDGGGALPLAGLAADLLLRLAPTGEAALHLPGGLRLAGATPDPLARLVENFRATGARRMRAALAGHGAAALLAGTGLAPLPAAPEPLAPEPVGFHPYPGTGRGAFGLAPEFGVLDGAGLAALADLAEEFGDGTLRLTPWRALLLAGVRRPAALARAAAGWIMDPADPRRRVVACPGAAGCASGQADTRADARALLARGAVPGKGLLHLSGCAKGCAHPAPAAAVLVAAPEGYALLRHARAGDPPLRTGLTLQEAAAELERAGLEQE